MKNNDHKSLSGKAKRQVKSRLKNRPIDLKLGKKGITENFVNEANLIITKEGMIKFSLSSEKAIRIKQAKELEQTLGAILISIVGRTASFCINHEN